MALLARQCPSGTEAEQISTLTQTLDDLSAISTESQALVSAWKSGDVAAVRRMTEDEAAADPTAFNRTVTARTRKWVPQIEKLLEQPKTTLVIAGAAHMVGELGLAHLPQPGKPTA